VLKAISGILNQLSDYSVIVFGADVELKQYLNENPVDKKIEIRGALTHKDVLKLMGKSLIYIGNSISDGMPNTLLEALIMGAFPIQSNPGGATQELINHQENGLIISEPENANVIKELILKAVNNKEIIEKAFDYNQKLKRKLDYTYIQKQVLKAYNQIEKDLLK
jgi:glycosyltransferase involved in cell wall biosynthesis